VPFIERLFAGRPEEPRMTRDARELAVIWSNPATLFSYEPFGIIG
jgi:hypothetical protein